MTQSQRRPAAVLDADTEDALAEAVRTLAGGGLVAVPTETVYGLACEASDADAVTRLYRAKRRPATNPLICHLGSAADASALAVMDDRADALAAAFWPGPLTLVLPMRPGTGVADAVTAGRDSIAVRVPSHPVLRALASRLGRPIAAPSANRAGRISATTAADVIAELGDAVDLVLDGGPASIGIESTIVGLTGADPVLLRPGAIATSAIEAVLNRPLADPAPERADAAMASPGRLASHYAPRATIRLDACEVLPGEAFCGFGGCAPAGAGHAVAALNLSETADLDEAARNLYRVMRSLDATGCAAIAVAPIPWRGIGAAINDRLQRAAAPRGPTTGGTC